MDLETHRSRYKYFYKHFGQKGAAGVRYPVLVLMFRRWIVMAGCGLPPHAHRSRYGRRPQPSTPETARPSAVPVI